MTPRTTAPPEEPTNEMLEAAVRECASMVDARFANYWNLYTLVWKTMYKAAMESRHTGEQR